MDKPRLMIYDQQHIQINSLSGSKSWARSVFDHTIEKTDAKKFVGKVSVSIKSNPVSTYGDRENFLCLTWPLMGAPCFVR